MVEVPQAFELDRHYQQRLWTLSDVLRLVDMDEATTMINLTDYHLNTPLHYVCQLIGKWQVDSELFWYYVALLQKIIDLGGDVNRENCYHSPLFELYQEHRASTVNLVMYLVSRGARVDVVDAHDRGLLHYSCSVQFSIFLLNHGAPLQNEDIGGNTPLSSLHKIMNNLVSEKDIVGLLELYTDHGLDIHHRDHDGRNLLDKLRARRRCPIVSPPCFASNPRAVSRIIRVVKRLMHRCLFHPRNDESLGMIPVDNASSVTRQDHGIMVILGTDQIENASSEDGSPIPILDNEDEENDSQS